MKILVCVKQVPDSESVFTLNEGAAYPEFDPRAVWRLNRYDEYALEEAVLISEKYKGVQVDAVSIGPANTADALKRALSVGAHDAYHLLYDKQNPIPSAFKAAVLAGFASAREYDLILTGVMSEDRGGSVTGPMTAALLDIGCATHAVEIKPYPEERKISIVSEIDSSLRLNTVLRLPALITVQSGINRPRYPSLTNVMRARSYDIPAIDVSTMADLPEVHENIRLVKPETGRGGVIHKGTSRELALEALKFFRSKSFL